MSCPDRPASRSAVTGWCGLTAAHRAAWRSGKCPFSAGTGDMAGRAASLCPALHKWFPACCPASWLRPLGAKRRALDDHSPETLLAGAAALAAKRIVGDTVALIEEERPFFLALLAHSRHGGSFLPFLSM